VTTNVWARALAMMLIGLAVVTAAGCGGQSKAHVSGKVFLDGQPIPDGAIEFFPVGATGQSAGAPIKDGVYQIEASVGEMRVTVSASEVVGKQKAYDTPDSPVIDIVRPSIPARYNTNSELRTTLVAGPNEVNFDLKRDKKK
jgi:hypothetical protein